MKQSEILSWMEKISAFKYLEPKHFDIIARCIEVKTFSKGELLSENGQFSFLGFIISGGVTYMLEDDNGNEVSVMDSFTRYPVGVIAAFDKFRKGKEFARAKDETTVLAIDFEKIEALKIKHPKLMMLFYQGLGELMSQVFMRLIFSYVEK